MRSLRGRGALPAALTAALVLAGCGGGEGSNTDEGPEPSSSESVGAPSEGTAEAYLEAPDDVELTEPGTALSLAEEATGAWMPRQDLVAVVDVAVTAMERASLRRDFAGYQFEGTEATSTPYLVRADVANVGETDLGGRRLPIYAVDDAGRLIEPSVIDRAFKHCPGSTLPAVFAAGDTATTCLVYLVPRGARLDAAMFRPPEGVAPLTWTGAVTAYEPPQPPKKPRKNRRNPTGGSGGGSAS